MFFDFFITHRIKLREIYSIQTKKPPTKVDGFNKNI